MWPLTTVKLPVVTLLASARANVTNGSRLLGYTLLLWSRNYFILKKEPESWHLALSAKKEVNVTVTAWQGGVTSDRLTSVQLANVTWLPPPPSSREISGQLTAVHPPWVRELARESLPARRPAAIWRLSRCSCFSGCLLSAGELPFPHADWLSRRLPQLFLFNLIFSDTVISATQLPKTSSMFNMLPPA